MDTPRHTGTADIKAITAAARKLSNATGVSLLVDTKPDAHTGGAVVVTADRVRHVDIFTADDLMRLL